MKAFINILSLALLISAKNAQEENDKSLIEPEKTILQPSSASVPNRKIGSTSLENGVKIGSTSIENGVKIGSTSIENDYNNEHRFDKNKELVKSDIDKRTGKVFFAFYSSTSVTVLVTRTQAALSTCVSTVAATCIGRKKKKSISLDFPDLGENFTSLDSGLTNVDTLADVPKNRVERKLTFWSTNYSTLTITTTSFISGTTVTVSAVCTIPGGITANTCFG